MPQGVRRTTRFVHMLHDAQSAFTSSCLPAFPWRRFPFPGFMAIAAALGTLVLDFIATQFCERKHQEEVADMRALVDLIAVDFPWLAVQQQCQASGGILHRSLRRSRSYVDPSNMG
ncbi:hypothetical protein ZIOFF_038351 [Zingiber officinale]|uniref:Uncharacterized protein n=1 Tax=Zingiber officinale TaxID=94328 RepID=A0A8J5G1B1_ZINOF|nr:hypothetical protein ZIOFF_038351 [Zingiber officinale]